MLKNQICQQKITCQIFTYWNQFNVILKKLSYFIKYIFCHFFLLTSLSFILPSLSLSFIFSFFFSLFSHLSLTFSFSFSFFFLFFLNDCLGLLFFSLSLYLSLSSLYYFFLFVVNLIQVAALT